MSQETKKNEISCHFYFNEALKWDKNNYHAIAQRFSKHLDLFK